MSQENVKLVTALIPPPGVDLAALARDDQSWAQLTEVIGPFFDPQFACVGRMIGETTYRGGLAAFRAFWLDWLAPWSTYQMVEIERTVDCGNRVLVIVRDVGRRKDAEHELKGRNAGVWTFRDGKAVHWEGFAEPADALDAVGLSE